MHFLRFGSSIPGDYWGCCAVCIIQNFKVMPTDKASIQLVSGDGGQPIMFSNMPIDKGKSGAMFAGKTYEEVFRQRLRYGTFGRRDMPNHAFFAVLTESQISGTIGKAWLKILKEEGFEFLRTTDNSVYTGDALAKGLGVGRSPHKNHVFALFRNVGEGSVKDSFTPPKAWTDLDKVVPEPWELLNKKDIDKFMKASYDAQLAVYNKLPKNEFYTEEELVKDGVPVIYAGKRSRYPQQLKEARTKLIEADKNMSETKATPFAKKAPSKVSVAEAFEI